MFRHQDIADYKELITGAHDFEGLLEEIASRDRAQVGQPPIATKGDEVEGPALLVTNKTLRHANIVHPMSQKRDMGHPLICGWSDLGHLPALRGGSAWIKGWRFRRGNVLLAQSS